MLEPGVVNFVWMVVPSEISRAFGRTPKILGHFTPSHPSCPKRSGDIYENCIHGTVERSSMVHSAGVNFDV